MIQQHVIIILRRAIRKRIKMIMMMTLIVIALVDLTLLSP